MTHDLARTLERLKAAELPFIYEDTFPNGTKRRTMISPGLAIYVDENGQPLSPDAP